MKVITKILTVPFLLGTAALGSHVIDKVNEPKTEQVTRDDFKSSLYYISHPWESLKDTPEIPSTISFLSLLGIGYNNRRKIKDKYSAIETKIEKLRDDDNYENLKQSILNSKPITSEDRTIVSNSTYSKLKEDILNNEHKILENGTIRQYTTLKEAYVEGRILHRFIYFH